MSSDPPHEDHSKNDPSKSDNENAEHLPSQDINLHNRSRGRLATLANQLRFHTPSRRLFDAGFQNTSDGDTARCDYCKLQVTNLTLDMDPFSIHSEQKPDCPFVRSIKASLSNVPSSASWSTTTKRNLLTSSEHENASKRQKIETNDSESLFNHIFETDSLQQIRRRTFSHWPHRTIPSAAQMIEAGFFNCNVGDRVICIYCNLICQQWTPHTDDPCEVHRTLSPNCMYVKTKLPGFEALPIINTDESSTEAAAGLHSAASNNLCPLRSHAIVFTAALNSAYAEIPKRHASFVTWPRENLPSVDDLVRAGFFYTGKNTIVSCFYCNGSLKNWGPNDNPMIEHARWFPHCPYAKQLCGDELHCRIQESKRAQQERASVNKSREKTGSGTMSNDNLTTNSRQLSILDENSLSVLVADRLKSSMSQHLLNQNFKLVIIKRCWEDQLRLKKEDFVTEADLYFACLILQKQIEHIDMKKENIIIPSIKMKQLQELNKRMREQSTTAANAIQSVSNTIPADGVTSSINETTSSNSNNQNQPNNSTPSNPCVVCFTEEKRIACIPCGHLATCMPCGHSLRSCPICRREIEAFVRIYL